MDTYQLTVIEQIWPSIPFLLFVSVLYWTQSKSIKQSMHGILFISALFYAAFICKYTGTTIPVPIYYFIPMYIFLITGLISVIYSFQAFSGYKWVHIIHSLTLTAAFIIWFIGSMAIGHD
jgi:hypothetical protein